jgi:hypothetical protein
MSETFDANRRLAEVALWVDGSARWVDRATEAARAAASRWRQVTVTFDQAELETFITGLRGVAHVLMGLAQPGTAADRGRSPGPPPAPRDVTDSPSHRACHPPPYAGARPRRAYQPCAWTTPVPEWRRMLNWP